MCETMTARSSIFATAGTLQLSTLSRTQADGNAPRALSRWCQKRLNASAQVPRCLQPLHTLHSADVTWDLSSRRFSATSQERGAVRRACAQSTLRNPRGRATRSSAVPRHPLYPDARLPTLPTGPEHTSSGITWAELSSVAPWLVVSFINFPVNAQPKLCFKLRDRLAAGNVFFLSSVNADPGGRQSTRSPLGIPSVQRHSVGPETPHRLYHLHSCTASP